MNETPSPQPEQQQQGPTVLELSLETLTRMFPALTHQFAKDLAALAADCANRPFNDKPRKLTLQVQLTPKIDTSQTANEALDVVSVAVVIKDSKPQVESRMVETKYRTKSGQPMLTFYEESPKANQPPLF